MIYNNRNPLSKIKSVYPNLFAKGQRIASVILRDPNKVIYQSIKELATECSTSESSIVRFCKTLGYSGYNELKLELAMCNFEIEAYNDLISEEKTSQSTIESITRDIFANTSALLQKLPSVLDYSAIEHVISDIMEAKLLLINGYIYSGQVAVPFCERIKTLGIPALLAWDTLAMRQNSILVDSTSVALFLSHSGASKDSVENAQQCKKNGAKIIVLTTSDHSPLAKEADILLTIPLFSNSVFEYYFPTETAFQLVLDAIYSGISLRQKTSKTTVQKTMELEYEMMRHAIIPYPPNSHSES